MLNTNVEHAPRRRCERRRSDRPLCIHRIGVHSGAEGNATVGDEARALARPPRLAHSLPAWPGITPPEAVRLPMPSSSSSDSSRKRRCCVVVQWAHHRPCSCSDDARQARLAGVVLGRGGGRKSRRHVSTASTAARADSGAWLWSLDRRRERRCCQRLSGVGGKGLHRARTGRKLRSGLTRRVNRVNPVVGLRPQPVRTPHIDLASRLQPYQPSAAIV